MTYPIWIYPVLLVVLVLSSFGEPMWALFAWFLFSFIFNILLASFLWLVETNDYQAGKAYFPDAKKEAHFNEYLQENNVDPNDSEAVLEHVKNMPKFQR